MLNHTLSSPLRVTFMGTPAFAVPSLKALLEHFHVVAVYTQPPKPAGRGHFIEPTPVHTCAQEHDVPVYTPISLKNPEVIDIFKTHHADINIVVAYGLILPQAILDAVPFKCINVHASLLPRWRGAAPIQHAVLAGDAVTGITTMLMDAGVDTGPLLMKQEIPIQDDWTSGHLSEVLSIMGAELLIQTLRLWSASTLTPLPQPDKGITLAPKLSKGDSPLHWHQSATMLRKQILGLQPWPVAHFTWGSSTIKVYDAEMIEGGALAPPGTVIDRHMTIACGNQQALRLLKVQPPGKPIMTGHAFACGHPTIIGACLE